MWWSHLWWPQMLLPVPYLLLHLCLLSPSSEFGNFPPVDQMPRRWSCQCKREWRGNKRSNCHDKGWVLRKTRAPWKVINVCVQEHADDGNHVGVKLGPQVGSGVYNVFDFMGSEKSDNPTCCQRHYIHIYICLYDVFGSNATLSFFLPCGLLCSTLGRANPSLEIYEYIKSLMCTKSEF